MMLCCTGEPERGKKISQGCAPICACGVRRRDPRSRTKSGETGKRVEHFPQFFHICSASIRPPPADTTITRESLPEDPPPHSSRSLKSLSLFSATAKNLARSLHSPSFRFKPLLTNARSSAARVLRLVSCAFFVSCSAILRCNRVFSAPRSLFALSDTFWFSANSETRRFSLSRSSTSWRVEGGAAPPPVEVPRPCCVVASVEVVPWTAASFADPGCSVLNICSEAFSSSETRSW